MAVTNIHEIYVTEAKSIAYIINPAKTEEGLYVDYYACSKNPNDVANDFQEVRDAGTGRCKVLAQHVIQSFLPGEITPEEAIEVGRELAEKLLKGNYQYVLATHLDKEHIHNHLIFNNVNFGNFRSFEYLENAKKQAYDKLRAYSDEICEKHGLYVILDPAPGNHRSHYEWEQNQKGLSWKAKLKFEIDNAIMSCSNFDEFLEEMKRKNIECVYNPEHKISLKFRMQGQEKYSRAGTMGWYYAERQIRKRISDFYLLKTGQLFRKPHTKIIDTSADKFQEQKYLERWADIQNMKEASKIINYLTTHEINDTTELENAATDTFNVRMQIVSKLNQLQAEIDAISETIREVRAYKQYKPIYDELQRKGLGKKAYEKQYAPELRKFESAVSSLKNKYPDNLLPTPESLDKKRKNLIDVRQTENERYKQIIKDLKELDYARTSINDYLKNVKEVQEQKQQRKKSELE